MLPEIIFFAESYHVIGSNADFLCPDIIGFIVFKINADINFILGHFHNFRAEFPCPAGCFVLEIIAEREVAEHFKESAVAGGDADSLDIGGTDALLACCDPCSRRGQLAREILFERSHTCIDKQKAFVALRNKRKARHSQVTLTLKKRKVFFSDLVKTHPFHCFFLLRNKYFLLSE